MDVKILKNNCANGANTLKATDVHDALSYLAAQANGILYCPSLLQAVFAFFSTF